MQTATEKAALHYIHLTPEMDLAIKLGQQPLTVSANTEALVQKTNTQFNAKPNKGFASFSEDSKFESQLEQFLQGRMGIEALSKDLSNEIIRAFCEFANICTGYLIVAQFKAISTDYLLVACIPIESSSSVDDALEVQNSDHLEPSKMDFAVRINLSDYRTTKSSKYISYIKPRSGRRQADIINQIFGTDETFDQRESTKQLVASVSSYLSQQQLDKDEKNQALSQFGKICRRHAKDGIELNLEALDEELGFNENPISSFLASDNPHFESTQSVAVSNSELQHISKFKGQGGGMTISFDKKLIGEHVIYDRHSDKLIFTKIPPNLRDQLIKAEAE